MYSNAGRRHTLDQHQPRYSYILPLIPSRMQISKRMSTYYLISLSKAISFQSSLHANCSVFDTSTPLIIMAQCFRTTCLTAFLCLKNCPLSRLLFRSTCYSDKHKLGSFPWRFISTARRNSTRLHPLDS